MSILLHWFSALLSIVLFAGCSAGGERAEVFSPTLAQPHKIPRQWQYVAALSDEFNAEGIDQTKWIKNPKSWGPWSWDSNNLSVAEGKLNITLNYHKHQALRRVPKKGGKKVMTDLFYTSGIIRSRQHQTYGYYEARIKGIPTFPGSSPAFWIYSIKNAATQEQLKNKEEGAVTYSEVDIVELQQAAFNPTTASRRDGANVIDMNLHVRMIEDGKHIWKRPGKYPELTRNKITLDFDVRDDFHIYGAHVTPDLITWYVDGEPVAQKENVYWHLPMYVTLSLGLRYPHVTYHDCAQGFVRCPVPSQATEKGYPSSMQVDWLRVYQ